MFSEEGVWLCVETHLKLSVVALMNVRGRRAHSPEADPGGGGGLRGL